MALLQSNAILRYIGRKYGLMGDDPLAVDLVLDQTSDFDAESTRRYGGGLPALKEYCEKDLGARLGVGQDRREAIHDWRYLHGR